MLAEAAKQTELKTGHPLRGVEIPVLDGLANGHKKDEEAPPVTEAPAELTTFFDGIIARLIRYPWLNNIPRYESKV